MGLNLTQKIISKHLVDGKMETGQPISIKIDQTLTQDSTGTMAFLQFEAMGIKRVKTEKSVAYIDHNILQTGHENADDHKYLRTAAAKYGVYCSRAGNGICHEVHLERFGRPAVTLLGSDSHTPTAGAIGMLGIGAGGLDVAVAMGGGPYHMRMPGVINIVLKGALPPWVGAKDIILEILRRLTVKGGVGKVLEYSGSGLDYLTVPQRATIANMGAELGATSSLFPSDQQTRAFLRAQSRLDDYQPLAADEDAEYDEEIYINLNKLEPLIACPHSPDNVKTVAELAGMKIDQVAIGSCTNAFFADMMMVAGILRGKTVAPHVSLVISPGSKQVLTMTAINGALGQMIDAGARILEAACGPCIGMGQAPASNAVSLRTFNRNFCGRSGTPSAQIYLVSPEVAAASAIRGVLTDPRELGDPLFFPQPENYPINDNMIVAPPEDGSGVEIVRGPNIKPVPAHPVPGKTVGGEVLIKLGDNVSTDHILPSTANLLPFRSNIPFLAEHCLTPCDPDFPAKAKAAGGGIVVGGSNYGQGSSREHAALAPLYLGIKAVVALSFARIHKDNLINNGILPLVFRLESDYERLQIGDELVIDDLSAQIHEAANSGKSVMVENKTQGYSFPTELYVSERQADILACGGLLNCTRKGK